MISQFNNPFSLRWEDIFYRAPAIQGFPPALFFTDENDTPFPEGVVDFGYVAPGGTSDRIIRIRNVGGSYLNLYELLLGLNGKFEVTVEADKTLLGAREYTQVTVRFTRPE